MLENVVCTTLCETEAAQTTITKTALPYSVERDVEVLHGTSARYHHPLAFTDGHHLVLLLRGYERHSVV